MALSVCKKGEARAVDRCAVPDTRNDILQGASLRNMEVGITCGEKGKCKLLADVRHGPCEGPVVRSEGACDAERQPVVIEHTAQLANVDVVGGVDGSVRRASVASWIRGHDDDGESV